MDVPQGRTRPLRRRAAAALGADRVHAVPHRRASCSSRCSRSRSCAARSSARSPASRPGSLLDTANLGTLGFTSLLLTVGGFWIGRYGETTARDRFHAPYLSVAVVTVLYALRPARAAVRARRAGAGRPRRRTGCRVALLAEPDPDLPVYALVRRLFPPLELGDRVREVRLLGSTPRPRPLPAGRPARRGAVPADAAARAARRGARLPRARRVRGALPAPLGAAGALRRPLPRPGERQPRAHDPARGAARRRSSTGTAACSSRTCPGTSLELWPADLPKTWRAQRKELQALSIVTGDHR